MYRPGVTLALYKKGIVVTKPSFNRKEVRKLIKYLVINRRIKWMEK